MMSVRCFSLAVFAALAGLTPAAAQSPIGQTIQTVWSDGNGTVDLRETFYVSSVGKIFQYIGTKATGHELKFGAWTEIKGKERNNRQRVKIVDNKVVWDFKSTKSEYTTIYEIKGDTCSIFQTGRDADPITVSWCKVSQGPPTRAE